MIMHFRYSFDVNELANLNLNRIECAKTKLKQIVITDKQSHELHPPSNCVTLLHMSERANKL